MSCNRTNSTQSTGDSFTNAGLDPELISQRFNAATAKPVTATNVATKNNNDLLIYLAIGVVAFMILK